MYIDSPTTYRKLNQTGGEFYIWWFAPPSTTGAIDSATCHVLHGISSHSGSRFFTVSFIKGKYAIDVIFFMLSPCSIPMALLFSSASDGSRRPLCLRNTGLVSHERCIPANRRISRIGEYGTLHPRTSYDFCLSQGDAAVVNAK